MDRPVFREDAELGNVRYRGLDVKKKKVLCHLQGRAPEREEGGGQRTKNLR